MGQVASHRAILAASLLLAGCAHHQAEPLHGTYVSLGSSFAAGTALGGLQPGTPERCGRSPVNYASLLAARLQLSLVDVACGGATSSHVLGPWNELPAQIEAVTADTRLVTITIGGNDLGYVLNLVAASCDPAKGMTFGGQQRPCPTMRLPDEADYARTEAALRDIARAVKLRAPAARLVFVQYVQLVPDKACPALAMPANTAATVRTIGLRLAQITQRAARAEGATWLAADQLSARHTPCDDQPWSTGPKPNGPSGNAPWHPNMAGHAALADALARNLLRD